MSLKLLIENKKKQLGDNFLPSCERCGLYSNDIENALLGIIQGKELFLSDLLEVSPEEIVRLAELDRANLQNGSDEPATE